LNNFFDGRDESWFYLITAEVEARGAAAIVPMLLAIDAIQRFNEEESQVRDVTEPSVDEQHREQSLGTEEHDVRSTDYSISGPDSALPSPRTHRRRLLRRELFLRENEIDEAENDINEDSEEQTYNRCLVGNNLHHHLKSSSLSCHIEIHHCFPDHIFIITIHFRGTKSDSRRSVCGDSTGKNIRSH
jgi:hypothetical protein